MQAWAPPPSPIALFLLGLDERGADGQIEIGGRRLHLRRGRLVDVSRGEGDLSLAAFMERSGRIDAQVASRLEHRPESDAILALPLPPETRADAVRALWLERLVQGLRRASAQGDPVPVMTPAPPGPSDGVELGLGTMVLDALQRSSEEDADEVGRHASLSIEWREAPFLARAQRWAGLSGRSDLRVTAVLSSDPAGAGKLAALARGGLLRLVPPTAGAPAPPPRPSVPPIAARPSAFPPATRRPSVLPPASDLLSRTSLVPEKPPELLLAPGRSRALWEVEPVAAPELPRFPAATQTLDDPLDAFELKIARLEQGHASPEERARAWRLFGDAWAAKAGALEEVARAYREAAAADPSDAELAEKAAHACAAIRQVDVALAYGRAAVAAQRNEEGRTAALLRYALFCRRLDRSAEALGAARAAHAAVVPDAQTHLLAADLEARHGLYDDAVLDRLEAASIVRAADAAHANALVSGAWLLAPRSPRAAEAFAISLADRGALGASLAVRRHAALGSEDPDTRRRLLLAAAERAELAQLPLVAADLQLEALSSEPALEAVYDSLDEDLVAAGLGVERALVLEELAASALPESRAELLARLADARAEQGLEPTWTLSIVARALGAGADFARVERTLDELGPRDPDLAADVIEEAAVLATDEGARRTLLGRLAAMLSVRPAGAARMAWALEARGVPLPSGLAAERAAEDSAQAQAEKRREGATGSQRREASLALARLLARSAEGRARAARLLDEILEDVPNDEAAELALRIALARGDVAAILRLGRLVAARGGNVRARARALGVAAAAAAELGDHAAAADAALGLVRVDKTSIEAVVRARRATERLGDVERLVGILRHEAQLAGPVEARARALVHLAELARDAGAKDEAVQAAQEALLVSPADGRAQILLLLLAEEHPPAPGTTSKLREVLGDLPALLRAEARALPEAALSLAATVRWATLEPLSVEPTLVALEECLARGVDDYLEPAIVALLEPTRTTPEAVTPIARGVARIAELGAVTRAVDLALRAAAHLGPLGSTLAELARDLAVRANDPARERAALELLLPSKDEAGLEARIEHLLGIAAVSERSGETALEARTLLRVLSIASRDVRAIDRLAHLYARTGERDRLMATLALLTEEGASDDERRRGLLALAAASDQVMGDPAGAEQYLAAAAGLAPGGGAAEGAASASIEGALQAADAMAALGRARRAIDMLAERARAETTVGAQKLWERATELAAKRAADPKLALAIAEEGLAHRAGWSGRLLLMFEELALDLRRTDVAERTYAGAIARAMGDRGRRALAYRRARWLERSGDKEGCLEALLAAAEKEGGSGAVATAIERVAREIGDLDALARGYVKLAKAARHPALRLGMVRKAVAVWENEAGRPEEAFASLLGEWKATFSSELEGDLARLANKIDARDTSAGDAAYGSLFAEIDRHAEEAWMEDEQARLRMKAARLHAARGETDVAETKARAAIAVLAKEEDPDATRLANLLAEVAGWLRAVSGRRADAIATAREALAYDAAHAGATEIIVSLGADPAAPAASDAVRPASVPAPAAPVSAPPPSMPSAPEEASGRPFTPPSGAGLRNPTALIEAYRRRTTPPPFAAAAPVAIPPPSVVPAIHTLQNVQGDAPTVAEPPGPEPSDRVTVPSRPPRDAPSAEIASAQTESANASPPPRARELSSRPPAPSPVALPDEGEDDAEAEPPSRASRIDLWMPMSVPAGAPSAPSLPPIAQPLPDAVALDAARGEGSTVALARELARAPDTRADASALYRSLLVTDPSRMELYGELADVADEGQLRAVAVIASAPLALAGVRPAPERTALVSGSGAGRLAEGLADPALSPVLAILARVLENVASLRQPLAQAGVVGTDRVAMRGQTPLARALTAVSELRGLAEPPVFATRRTNVGVAVLRSSPPAVLVAPDYSRDELELRFALGRALELARPEHALVATLTDAEGQVLFSAIRAAFGPPDGTRPTREAAMLANELFQMPMRVQRDVRELLGASGPAFDWSATRTGVLASAGRAGLLAAGDLHAALLALRRIEGLPDTAFGSPERVADAFAKNALLSDLVRFALADAFVEAVRVD